MFSPLEPMHVTLFGNEVVLIKDLEMRPSSDTFPCRRHTEGDLRHREESRGMSEAETEVTCPQAEDGQQQLGRKA